MIWRGITLGMALEVAQKVIQKARKDEGDPIAVTIVGLDGQPIVTLSMNEVIGISPILSWKKAWTALMAKKETFFWEENRVDPRNFAHPNFTSFGGGIPVFHPTNKVIVGAIGVSGRKSHADEEDTKKGISHDHELANLGKMLLINELEKA